MICFVKALVVTNIDWNTLPIEALDEAKGFFNRIGQKRCHDENFFVFVDPGVLWVVLDL